MAVTALSGCAGYSRAPLPVRPDLATRLPLTVDAATLGWPDLGHHVFDSRDGMDMAEVAIVAVLNNPELKVARAQAGIAHAQAFAAGLLPDPQLGFSTDYPQSSDPALTNALNLGLTYDFGRLITLESQREAAAAGVRKADLEVLWQEWLVISQARLLYVRALAQERLRSLLDRQSKLLRDRYERTRQAVEDGNLTIDRAAAFLAALQNVDTRLNEATRSAARIRHDLNTLLGLSPEVVFQLVPAEPAAIDQDSARRMLPGLVQRRPDLLALQAGYEAQEELLRAAVLAQFPAFSLGISRARDTAGLYTEGFSVSITLPVFNRNRGAIAIQTASRQRLHDEYRARINNAYGDVDRLLENGKILEKQREQLRHTLVEMSRAVAAVDIAFKERIMDVLQFVTIETAFLDKQIEAVNLDQILMEHRVALQTVIGPDPATARSFAKETK